MTEPVFFKPHDPDIPTHLWSSARWESRTKWGYWVMFVLIEFGIAYLSDFVWSMGAHLLACIMFTAVSLGFVTWHYFWWLHERPLKSMHRLFDRNIGGASGLPVHPERTCTLRGAEGQDLVEYQGIPHRAKRSGHKLL